MFRKYLFGPVNSRRLGRSLGIDLLPFKTCSFDCIYCECGRTSVGTLQRKEFFPTTDVIWELDRFLATEPELDYVTFSGSGEPTLHSGIGEIIRYLKSRHPRYKVAVLTNGSLLGDEDVQAQLHTADLVIPSLDGATEATFQRICQPVPGLTAAAVIKGIASFRRSFPGLLLLEIFIVPGLNDNDSELHALKLAATTIAPDAIQLNSLDRPAPDPNITIPQPGQLERIREYFYPLQVQAVRKRADNELIPWNNPEVFRAILDTLGKGASTLPRLSVAIGLREGDLAKTLAQMSTQSLLCFNADSGAIAAVPPA
jgi:wyosine [tRNA(Phe)-imidazoG37] synthetase (radical SAM superfamily)